MPWLSLLFLIVVLQTFVAYLIWRWIEYSKNTGPRPKAGAHFDSGQFDKDLPVSVRPYQLSRQPESWRKRMSHCGDLFLKADIQHIFFMHGTFVGHDPFDMYRLIEHMNPGLGQKIDGLKTLIKKGQNQIIKDRGNFTPDYLNLFNQAVGQRFYIHNFEWSSANHHYARLCASFELLKQLNELNYSPSERILFIGHSHAGQVMALLTQMIHRQERASHFAHLYFRQHQDFEWQKALKKVSKLSLDFVTLGSPNRYEWDLAQKQRVLHIMNHRGRELSIKGLHGILFTKWGDYVQALACPGSDSKATLLELNEYNDQLSEFLGTGSNLKVWSQLAKSCYRPSIYGKNLLVDYLDGSKIPNCLMTVFGHGVYTRFDKMLYNTECILNHLYEE